MTNVKEAEDLRHPDAEQLLHSPDPARLAYNGRDGFPRVIPIGFLWNGTDIVVCTAPTAPKVKALAERPNVALTIDIIGPPAKALLVRGVASIEIVDGVPPEYLAAAAKSTSGDELAAFEAHVRVSTSRWRGSRLRRHGHASTTLARAACRPFCVDWSTPHPAERSSTRDLFTSAAMRVHAQAAEPGRR